MSDRSPYATDDDRWAAIAGRDRDADGAFFCAVRTTGIYCRPDCPSRMPKRRNVAFFDTRAEAEAAGYRPCKRCRPDAESPRRTHAGLIARACQGIERAERPPTLEALAAEAGLSPWYFHRLFKEIVGVTPKRYAAAHRDRRFRARLAERFPKARLREAEREFADLVGTVTAFVEAPRRGLDLPLDIRGTAFQRRVWEALREVPPGATVSYGDLAGRIGRPAAARAVARACAANRIALAIPCHRAVRGDGAPGGYRWGTDRKRALLEREGEAG